MKRTFAEAMAHRRSITLSAAIRQYWMKNSTHYS